MRLNFRFTAASIAVLTTLAGAASAEPVPITDYRVYKDAVALPLVGQGTDDPVVGELATAATGSFLLGYLPSPITLGANEGDRVTLSFDVHFRDTAGMTNAGDNFRFALFDLNGEAQDSATGGSGGGPSYNTAGTTNTDDFRGYWFGVRNGTGTGSGGSIRERMALLSGANPFSATGANTGTAPSLGPVGGDPVTLESDDVEAATTGPDYTGVLKLTRTASGVDLSGFFIGSNGATGNVYTASDNVDPFTTFGAVGFLIGNALSSEQVLLSNITVSTWLGPGDYDNDNDVDDADYGVWKGSFGGTMDGNQLLDWQRFYGTNVPGGGVGAIPEPASSALAALVLAVGAGFCSRRRMRS